MRAVVSLLILVFKEATSEPRLFSSLVIAESRAVLAAARSEPSELRAFVRAVVSAPTLVFKEATSEPRLFVSATTLVFKLETSDPILSRENTSSPVVPSLLTALNANLPSSDAVRRILSAPTANTSVRNIFAIQKVTRIIYKWEIQNSRNS